MHLGDGADRAGGRNVGYAHRRRYTLPVYQPSASTRSSARTNQPRDGSTLRVYVLLCCLGARYATIRTHRTPQKHHCSSRIHMSYPLERDGLSRTKLHSRTVKDDTAGLLQTRYRSHCCHGTYSSECSKVTASAFEIMRHRWVPLISP